jgi:hypothetical protein
MSEDAQASAAGPELPVTPTEPHRPGTHLIQNWLVGAALLAELVVLAGHPLFGWGTVDYTATPRPLVYAAPVPPSGAEVLLVLAAQAARRPADGRGPGAPYAYVRRRSWSVSTQPAGKLASVVHPTVTESWLRTDGTGRVLSATSTGARSRTRDLRLDTGRALPELTSVPAALASRLGLGYPGPAAPAAQFAVVADITGRQPVTGPVQATLLRLLSRLPELVNNGTVVDRAGRPGVAVSVNSTYLRAQARFTLIFNGATGQLAEEDVTLIGSPESLHVRPGSVLAYRTFLASGWVAGTSAVP